MTDEALSFLDVPGSWHGTEPQRAELLDPWDTALHNAKGAGRVRARYADQLEDAGDTELRIASDYTGRFAIELLQNAQDACADAGTTGRAWFRISESSLMVANEGVSFDPARIRSLTRLGGSSKTSRSEGKHHTIGYKGIGFSAVFEISDRPQIITRGLAFGFDRERARQHVSELLETPAEKVPGRYFPFFLTEEDWKADEDVVEELLSEGAVTVVRLPFRENLDPQLIAATVRSSVTASSLLLMPSLNAIDIDGVRWTKRRGIRLGDAQVHHLRNSEGESESWLVLSGRAPIAASVVQALTEEVWHDVRSVSATVALPWRDGGIDLERDDQPMHVFFPTSDRIGRRLLVHGDFVLESNRKHVQSEGAGGRVTDVVADLAAALCARLAEETCEQRPSLASDVVRALTPLSRTSGFGANLAERIDGRLGSSRFVPTTAGALATPKGCLVFDADVDPPKAALLASVFTPDRPLAVFTLEEPSRDFLVELDADRAPHRKMVQWFDATTGQSYSRVVLAVETWEATAARKPSGWLRGLEFLQSDTGEWRAPRDLITPVEGVPGLPTGLTRETYAPPPHPGAAEFVKESCQPDALTLKAATALVFEEVEAGRYGVNDVEAQAAFGFVKRVWRREKTIVRAMPADVLRVPARAWRRGSRRVWESAGNVYFSSMWLGNSDLELVYRKTDALFLDEDPPARAKQDRRAFYRALGVADRPRRVAVSQSEGPWGWRSEVGWAFACPEGHEQSGRAFECDCITDLGEILDDLDRPAAKALARLLAASDAPYGAETRARCTNTSHRKRVWRDTIGLQRWLLEQQPWVPVVGPDGEELARPVDAWTHVNSEGLKAILPNADLSGKVADKLELPSATSPRPEHVIRAIERLATRYKKLDECPTIVRDGLLELLQKLEVSLKRRTTFELPHTPLPVLRLGASVWDDSPRIPDVPVASELPVAVLPDGHWQNLSLAAGLTPLSAETATVANLEDLRDEAGSSLYLDDEGRAALAAILHQRVGHDLQGLAAKLGRLTICSASKIDVEYRHEPTGARAVRSVLAHLDWPDSTTPRLTALRDLPDEALQVIAAELGKLVGHDDQLELLLFLTSGRGAAKLLGVGDSALSEASAALARYRNVVPKESEISRESKAAPAAAPAHPIADAEAPTPEGAPEGAEDGSPAPGAANGEPGQAAEPNAPAGSDSIRTAWSSPPTVRADDGFAPDLIEFKDTECVPEDRPVQRERARAVAAKPSGARGGSGRSGFPSLSAEERQEVEQRAVDIARRLATERFGCVDVRDVQDDNVGWDLEFDFGGARWWPVEVKGFGGSIASFIITRNERRAAAEQDEYRLLLIDGTRAGGGHVIMLRPGSWLTDADLEPMSWVVREWDEGVIRTMSWVQADPGSHPL